MSALISLICLLGLNSSEGPISPRYPLAIDEGNSYIGVARDLVIIDEHLYQLENRRHRLLKIRLGDPLEIVGVIATKGDGPGELFTPSRITHVPGQGYIVLDNRGFSLFDYNDRFIRRFRKFTPLIDITSSADRLFYASLNPRNTHLIEVMDLEGNKVTTFLDQLFEVGTVKNTVSSQTNNLLYMHGGFISSDTNHLYYINTTMLRFLKLDHRGTVLLDKDLSSSFGPKGMSNVQHNLDYIKDPGALENPNGVRDYSFFSDAYLFNGRIYLLRTSEPDRDRISTVKDIIVLDPSDFSRIHTHHFTVEKGEYVHAMAVHEQQGKARILLNMETKQSIDVQIVALTP